MDAPDRYIQTICVLIVSVNGEMILSVGFRRVSISSL